MKFRLSLTLIVLVCIGNRSAYAEDLYQTSLHDLQTIPVSSIDFSERSLEDSLASARIITDDMFARMPVATLGETFELLVPGVVVLSQGNNGAGLGVRGSGRGGSVRTLTLWDGQSLNRSNDGGNNGVYFSPLTGDLQQAEVVLGAGSVKHGSGALHGYINFVPKNGVDHAGNRLSLDYGLNDESVRLQFERGYSYGQDRSLYWYAGFYQAEGFQVANDFGGASSPSRSEQQKFLNRDDSAIGNYDASYKASLNWLHGRFNMKALFENLEFNPNTLVAGFDSLSQRTSLTLQPKYTLQLPFKSSVELSSSVSFFDRSRILDALDPGRPDQKRGGSESASDLRITMQNNYFDKHELVLGAQIKRLDSRTFLPIRISIVKMWTEIGVNTPCLLKTSIRSVTELRCWVVCAMMWLTLMMNLSSMGITEPQFAFYLRTHLTTAFDWLCFTKERTVWFIERRTKKVLHTPQSLSIRLFLPQMLF